MLQALPSNAAASAAELEPEAVHTRALTFPLLTPSIESWA